MSEMKRDEMIQRIDIELDHIPPGNKGSPQNELRMFYNIYRRRHLGRYPEAVASTALRTAIATLAGEYPDFRPSFDRHYFGM